MEQLINKSGGKPLHQDPAHHIRKATTFEDLGTSKFMRKAQSKPAPGSSKPSTEQKKLAPTRSTRRAVLEDDDSDEMDLLSESNCPEDDDTTFPSSQPAASKDDSLQRHINVSTAIKSMSFRKKSSTSTPNPASSSVPDSRPKSQRVASTGIKDLTKKTPTVSSPREDPLSDIPSTSRPKPKPKPRSKPVDDTYDTPLPKPKPRRPNVQSSKASPSQTKGSLSPFPLSSAVAQKTGGQKSKPAPFPLAADSEVETTSPRRIASTSTSSKLAKQPSLAKFPLAPSQDQEDKPSRMRKEKTREPMPFPLDSTSLDSLANEDEGSRSSSKGGKENDKGKAKALDSVRKRSPSRRKVRDRKTILSSDDDEEASPPPPKASKKSLAQAEAKKGRHNSKNQSLQPFPLSGGFPSLGKRVSEDGSDDDRTAKKRRELDILDSPAGTFFDDEGDSLLFTTVADPKTLCPYCDEPLPSTPSPRLLTLLKQTRAKSRKDPRPANALGLTAKLEHFSNVCSRHRFEQTLMPQAEREGWPRTIKWDKLERRIIRMKPYLEGLVDGSNKGQSPFWASVLKEVESKGSRAVTGVHGQFANFEKVQPGYYGELGSVIIHQTLFGIFPATAFDPTVIQPLTVSEFILLVLVPEVATRLIMEDKGLEGEKGVSEAISIMQASAFYGSSMFPEDAGDGEERQMGVGDRMLMERAMKRRKEIEEEEGDEVEPEEESVHEKKTTPESRGARAARRANGPSKEAKTEVAPPTSSMPPQSSQPKPRPRPKPVVKTESSMNIYSDINEPSPLASVPPSKLVSGSAKPPKSSTSKPVRRSGRSHLVKVDSDMEVETDQTADGTEGSESEEESESGGLDSRKVPRSLRRSPSASEWSRRPPDPKAKPKPRPKAVGSTSTRKKGYLSTSESDADMKSDVSSKANVGRSKQDRELKTPVASRRSGLRGGNGGGAGLSSAQAPIGTAVMGADETPRPSRKGDPVNASSNGDTPPLMRARRRAEERQRESEGWEKNMRGDTVGSSSKVEGYEWLFSD